MKHLLRLTCTTVALLVLPPPAVLQTAPSACPPSFSQVVRQNSTTTSCLMLDMSAPPLTWCQANRRCWDLGGGHLMTDAGLLASLAQLANTQQNVWIGASDIADERRKDKTGWQLVASGSGQQRMPPGLSGWGGEPNNLDGVEDCVCARVSDGGLNDDKCSDQKQYVCQQQQQQQVQHANSKSNSWRLVPFGRTFYNAPAEYCYADMVGAETLMHCVQLAAGHRYPVGGLLYNWRSGQCRLIEFTGDAQVEAEVENSADWAKYLLSLQVL